jgi:outer membrane protein assembly factor BamD (BamD/ComL family)
MQKHIIKLIISTVILISLNQAQFTNADTSPKQNKLEQKDIVNNKVNNKFQSAILEAKKLVDNGKTSAAKEAYKKIKDDFPDIVGKDFDLFVKAELYFCKGKYSNAAKYYEKLLNQYPDTQFSQTTIDRQFTIAKAFLAGRKKTIFRVFKMKAHTEGAKIMEKITDRASDDSIALNAATNVAEYYENKDKFNEAYLKWSEILSRWTTGQIAKDALLAMARCKHALYNKNPKHKRPLYDASCLTTAKSYYEKFQLLYPNDANDLNLDEKIKQINEQIAEKQLTIGQYYQRTGKKQAANLYFDMVVQDWPETNAAKKAKELLALNSPNENQENE